LQPSVHVKNLRQLHSALKRYNLELKLELEDRLKAIGEDVAANARDRFASVDPYSAAGIKPRLRGFGRVQVVQSRRRKTGTRPDYGSLQMRTALLPAVWESKDRIMDSVENMLDTLGRANGF